MDQGEKLALARKYHAPSLGQKELALKLGLSTSTIGRWESQNHIPEDKLPHLSAIFGVPVDWFTNGDDTLPSEVARVGLQEPTNLGGVLPAAMTRTEREMVSGQYASLPVWEAVLGSGEEELSFIENDRPEFKEIPAFYTLGHPERHVLCIIKGMSMAPRIEHSERALIKLDPNVPPEHLVVARSPDQRNFIKRLVKRSGRLELHSVNKEFRPITDLTDWELKGGVIMIEHVYEIGKPNIEWDHGRFLRATTEN